MFSITGTAEDPERRPWFRFFLLQQPFGLDVPEFWNILSSRGSLGAFKDVISDFHRGNLKTAMR